MAETCCAHFREHQQQADHGNGLFEQGTDGFWSVNGCCGGGCYVVKDIAYCPFCGARIAAPPQKEAA